MIFIMHLGVNITYSFININKINELISSFEVIKNKLNINKSKRGKYVPARTNLLQLLRSYNINSYRVVKNDIYVSLYIDQKTLTCFINLLKNNMYQIKGVEFKDDNKEGKYLTKWQLY
jgi:hypothetical protein